MADQYDFKWTVASLPGITVQPQTKDTSTSLVLTGRGSPNWGKDLQQNLLKLLETFAAPTPPTNGVTGQLWYDTTNKVLHVYDASVDATNAWAGTAGGGVTASATAPTNPKPGTQWYDLTNGILKIWDGQKYLQVFPAPAAVVQKLAFVTEYNAMAATLNQITSAPQGATLAAAYGWGQTDIVAAETIFTMSNAKWISLLTKLTGVCNYLGVATAGISTDGFMYEYGNTIPYGSVTMLQKYNDTLTTLNSLTAGTVRFKPVAGSLETTVPASGTATRATVWSGTITHEVVGTFASADAMNAFFNAGGQFQFFSSETNAGTNRDYDWMAFLGNIGTVKFSATGSVDSANRSNPTGLYDLTSTYKLIFSVANPTNPQQVFTINAKIDSAKAVHFQLVYTDTGTLYGGVGGTLTSATSVVRPNQAVLKSPVFVYPTVTQTALA